MEEIRALPSMHPGRADVITGGALIATRVAARTPVPELIISESDILDGIALELLGSRPRRPDGRADWDWQNAPGGTTLAITVRRATTGPASSRGRPRCWRDTG